MIEFIKNSFYWAKGCESWIFITLVTLAFILGWITVINMAFGKEMG